MDRVHTAFDINFWSPFSWHNSNGLVICIKWMSSYRRSFRVYCILKAPSHFPSEGGDTARSFPRLSFFLLSSKEIQQRSLPLYSRLDRPETWEACNFLQYDQTFFLFFLFFNFRSSFELQEFGIHLLWILLKEFYGNQQITKLQDKWETFFFLFSLKVHLVIEFLWNIFSSNVLTQ